MPKNAQGWLTGVRVYDQMSNLIGPLLGVIVCILGDSRESVLDFLAGAGASTGGMRNKDELPNGKAASYRLEILNRGAGCDSFSG